MATYVILRSIPDFLWAALETLKIAVCSAFLSLVLGIILAALYQSRIKIFMLLISVYANLIRSTPLLVQLYFLYYGLPFLGIHVDKYPATVFAFTVNTGAYVVEILRGGLEGIDQGQFNAAYSLGMTWTGCLSFIIFPQVLRRVISPLLTQMAYLIKDTSLAAVLVIAEVTYTYKRIAAETYRSFEALVLPVIIYFSLYVIFRAASSAFQKDRSIIRG